MERDLCHGLEKLLIGVNAYFSLFLLDCTAKSNGMSGRGIYKDFILNRFARLLRSCYVVSPNHDCRLSVKEVIANK